MTQIIPQTASVDNFIFIQLKYFASQKGGTMKSIMLVASTLAITLNIACAQEPVADAAASKERTVQHERIKLIEKTHPFKVDWRNEIEGNPNLWPAHDGYLAFSTLVDEFETIKVDSDILQDAMRKRYQYCLAFAKNVFADAERAKVVLEQIEDAVECLDLTGQSPKDVGYDAKEVQKLIVATARKDATYRLRQSDAALETLTWLEGVMSRYDLEPQDLEVSEQRLKQLRAKAGR